MKKLLSVKLLTLGFSLIVSQSSQAFEAPRRCVVDVQPLIDEAIVNLRRIGVKGNRERSFKAKWDHYIRPEIALEMSWALTVPLASNVSVTFYSSDPTRIVLRPEKRIEAPDAIKNLVADYKLSFGVECNRTPINSRKEKKTCYHYYTLLDSDGTEIDRERYATASFRLHPDEDVQYTGPGPKTGRLIKLIERNIGHCSQNF